MHLLRTRFAEDIVAEFLPPKKTSSRVVILCAGLPGMPTGKRTMEHFAKKGFWVFAPRYRGSWESGGELLNHSPHEDILDVIDGISKPIISLWDGAEYRINDPEIIVVGSSFGGPAAILCSSDPRVRKAIALSPVVDWRAEEESPAEPMDWLGGMVKQAFGAAYRFTEENWKRLARGEFYNPVDQIDQIDSSKLVIIHSIDDDVVLYDPVRAFADQIDCEMITLKCAGHLGASRVLKWSIWRKIKRHINS